MGIKFALHGTKLNFPVQCDGTNYHQFTGVTATILTTWRGIAVCGPRSYTVSTPDNYVNFPGGSTEQEFECTDW